MGKLNKLFGKPVEKEIGGELLTFYPLSISEMGLLTDLKDESKAHIALLEILKKSLKDEAPTQEEIDKIEMKHFKELVAIIADVNGFKDDMEKAMKKAEVKEA